MNRIIPIYLLFFTIAVVTTAGCEQKQNNKQETQITQSAVETRLTAKNLQRSGTAARYHNGSLVSIGEQLHFNQSSHKNIRSEYFDQRGSLFSTLDNKNRLVIADSDTQAVYFSKPLPFILETLCLYQQPGALQIFLLDEKHIAHQMLVRFKPGKTAQLTLQKIRQLPVPPGSEFCAVDDNSQRLFVSEENIGVWAYNARAESEISRTPVALVAPYGSLASNPGPIAISNGYLWIAEAGAPYLHQVELNNFSQQQAYSLAKDTLFETLTASAESSNNRLVWFDEHSESLQTVSLQAQSRNPAITPIVNIAASAETQPVTTDGDAADDPAIWINTQQPENSRILGTNKKFGLHVYDLQGNTLQTLTSGRVNNVDIRQGFRFKSQAADIASASQRDNNSIALYHIDPQTGLTSEAGEIATTLDEVYGLCMGRGVNDEVFVFINDEDGRFEQYQISDSASGWSGELIREFAVNSQPEGCVSDDNNQRLFVGEENHGIWTLDLADNNSELQLIQSLENPADNQLHADIEGLDIYHGKQQSYLVASSQGNDSYVLFDSQPPFSYQGHFRVAMNTKVSPIIDGASETDGLAVTSVNLGDQYPQGLLVVQDGRNLMPAQYQNFKLVSWQDIATELTLK